MHRPGFFELTPGRRVFLAAAGVAALTVVGYVGDAFDARRPPIDQREPPPFVPPPPPVVNPSVALREAAAALDRAERTAADRTAKAGAAAWQVAQAELHLRALAGRPLAPADEAERVRLVERAAAARAALGAGGR